MKRLIYYNAKWCQPCKTLSPIIDQIAQSIPVEKIDIDYELNRAQAAKVSSIPTVILVEGETEIRRFTGVRSYEQVMQFINS
jgi:thioredoxin-like negative regulator of GroEL